MTYYIGRPRNKIVLSGRSQGITNENGYLIFENYDRTCIINRGVKYVRLDDVKDVLADKDPTGEIFKEIEEKSSQDIYELSDVGVLAWYKDDEGEW